MYRLKGKGGSITESNASSRALFVAFLMSFNAFTWSYLTVGILENILEFSQIEPAAKLPYIALYYSALGIFNIVGQLAPRKSGRLNFLYAWAVYGGFVTLLPALYTDFSLNHLALFSFILGASVGIGIPSTLAYLSDMTAIEERGKVSGITLFASYASLILLTMLPLNFVETSIIYAVWRFSVLATLLLRPKKLLTIDREKGLMPLPLQPKKLFLLYLIPWTMFSFVDQSTKPVVMMKSEMILHEQNILGFLNLAGVIAGALSCLLGGVLSDRIGRKKTITLAVALLGLGYAFLGLAPYETVFWFYYSIVDGIAWGILTCTCFFVIWGDLSRKGSREKYYSIGVLPYFLAGVVSIAFSNTLATINADSVFSLACLFLFLSILPLLIASETLPQEAVEQKLYRKYMEDAKKLRERLNSH
jgi:MFS family permease